MEASIATITLESMSAMSQSRKHDTPLLEGEDKGKHDERTWRDKMHVDVRNGKPTVVIPAHALHMCFADGAKYTKRKIEGQGKATWTAKFMSGIMLSEDPSLDIDPATVPCVKISANVNGIRGVGGRVDRRFPQILKWKTSFDVYIIDPIITEDIFREMVEKAGMFIGIGQNRPQTSGGSSGRFKIGRLVWQDNRRIAA